MTEPKIPAGPGHQPGCPMHDLTRTIHDAIDDRGPYPTMTVVSALLNVLAYGAVRVGLDRAEVHALLDTVFDFHETHRRTQRDADLERTH